MSEYFTLGRGGVALPKEKVRDTPEEAAADADRYLRYNTTERSVEVLRVRTMVFTTVPSPYVQYKPVRKPLPPII